MFNCREECFWKSLKLSWKDRFKVNSLWLIYAVKDAMHKEEMQSILNKR